MTSSQFLLPMFAMVALTAIVWVKLLRERIGEIRTKRIPMSQLTTSARRSLVLENTNAADNLSNLSELPILFYVFCLAAQITQQASIALIIGSWLFVILRATHSYIHCSYNNVLHRFYIYAAGSVVLFALWIGIAVSLID